MVQLNRSRTITEPIFHRLDKPETWIAIHGFLVSFAWEMFQMPFYAMDQLSVWQVTKSCDIASVGDAGIMVFAYWIAAIATGDRIWLRGARARALTAYLGTGLSITIVVEHLALRSDWGWQYDDTMPLIGGVGLVPLVMWIIVPLVTMKLAERSVVHSGPTSQAD
jgi:hypothetical protein